MNALTRKRNLGKDDLTVICDMRIFFHKKRIVDLASHETRLSLTSSHINEVRVICWYENPILTLLTQQQTQQILNTHKKVLRF